MMKRTVIRKEIDGLIVIQREDKYETLFIPRAVSYAAESCPLNDVILGLMVRAIDSGDRYAFYELATGKSSAAQPISAELTETYNGS